MANEIAPSLFFVIPGRPNPAADTRSLLEALKNTKAAKEKLDRDHHAERLKSVLSLATEAAKSANADSFVNRRRQLEEMEAKCAAHRNALAFFAEVFQELVKDYINRFRSDVKLVLEEILQRLKEAKAELNGEDSVLNKRIIEIEQLLELCSPRTDLKAEAGTTRPRKGRRSRG